MGYVLEWLLASEAISSIMAKVAMSDLIFAETQFYHGQPWNGKKYPMWKFFAIWYGYMNFFYKK